MRKEKTKIDKEVNNKGNKKQENIEGTRTRQNKENNNCRNNTVKKDRTTKRIQQKKDEGQAGISKQQEEINE